jgi:predicted amidohydrolase
MQVTSIQLEIKNRSKSETVEHALRLLDTAPKSDLILLPEIWSIGAFSFKRFEAEAESIDGPTVKVIREKARKLGSYIFMGSFIEREGKNLFNTSLLLSPSGEVLARYRKIHLFGFESEERKLLKAGQEVVVVTLPWGKVGLSTCYDLRFPELYRKMVDLGAESFLVTSAWPESRLHAWTLFNRARAHENLAFLFSCNCAGTDSDVTYAGNSLFVNPLGEVVAEAGTGEEILTVKIDLTLVNQVRTQFPALRDRVL